MKKIMLIAGCSHTSGSEINGTEDSEYNRQHSYGNQLAYKLGYEPINFAEPGSTNPTIARSILEWFNTNYKPEEMKVFVLIGWTESTRMEVPWHNPAHYGAHCPYGDYYASSGSEYLRINMGWLGLNPEEKEIIPSYHTFIAQNEKYLEIISANAVLQLQYFLKMHKVDYTMCNVMHMFTSDKHLDFYTSLIDATKYMHVDDNDLSFYTRYKTAGYTNPKAKYWHHDEIPHRLYAEELFNFIGENKCLS
jgi:hypothetical protein